MAYMANMGSISSSKLFWDIDKVAFFRLFFYVRKINTEMQMKEHILFKWNWCCELILTSWNVLALFYELPTHPTCILTIFLNIWEEARTANVCFNKNIWMFLGLNSEDDLRNVRFADSCLFPLENYSRICI